MSSPRSLSETLEVSHVTHKGLPQVPKTLRNFPHITSTQPTLSWGSLAGDGTQGLDKLWINKWHPLCWDSIFRMAGKPIFLAFCCHCDTNPGKQFILLLLQQAGNLLLSPPHHLLASQLSQISERSARDPQNYILRHLPCPPLGLYLQRLRAVSLVNFTFWN